MIRLPDGRALAYSELGDPKGAPIVHHHGMPGSRLDHQASLDVYRELGVRVLVPDRPGYGLSDPHPGASLSDWADDVAHLADAAGVERFGITALSGGGIYALACAAVIPERITRVVTTGCPAPMDHAGARDRMRLMTRAGVWFGAHMPVLLSVGVGAMAGVVRRYPGFFIAEATRANAPVDRRWLTQAFVKAGEQASMREAFRHGADGYVDDLIRLSTPWGFAVEDIRVPVQLWHGADDSVIPPGHSRFLAAHIPGSTIVICPGEGHMLLWNHLPEILRTAAAGSSLRRAA